MPIPFTLLFGYAGLCHVVKKIFLILKWISVHVLSTDFHFVRLLPMTYTTQGTHMISLQYPIYFAR